MGVPLPGAVSPVAGEGVIQVVHTDDTATKLSDRVKGRFLNCCPTVESGESCECFFAFRLHFYPRLLS
jgi:hypothetical protein